MDVWMDDYATHGNTHRAKTEMPYASSYFIYSTCIFYILDWSCIQTTQNAHREGLPLYYV